MSALLAAGDHLVCLLTKRSRRRHLSPRRYYLLFLLYPPNPRSAPSTVPTLGTDPSQTQHGPSLRARHRRCRTVSVPLQLPAYLHQLRTPARLSSLDRIRNCLLRMVLVAGKRHVPWVSSSISIACRPRATKMAQTCWLPRANTCRRPCPPCCPRRQEMMLSALTSYRRRGRLDRHASARLAEEKRPPLLLLRQRCHHHQLRKPKTRKIS